ncbi:aldolase, partial [Frankia sp. AiPs1]|nr:aldolase [Frankia sp. AiPs1]
MPTLPPDVVARLTAALDPVDADLAARQPGGSGARQPVHTCYLPADQMVPDVVPAWGARARALLAAYGPDPA